MAAELLQIHVAEGMSISVGRHVGSSGQVVQNAHIIKLQGQWQLFVQESQNQPWRTYLNGHLLPDNSQHSLTTGAFISFGNNEYGRASGFNIENGWIKVGDSSLTMGVPGMPGLGAPMPTMPYPAAPMPPAPQQMAAMPTTEYPPSIPSPKQRGGSRRATTAGSEAREPVERGSKGKKVYRCTGEWIDDKTGAVVKCTKTFTTSGHLARHKRLHGGEKPYKCPIEICNSRFSRHDNMNQHYRAHARKLGLEVVPQTAPPKNAVSEEASDEDDDDDDDDFEAPPSRSGTASRPRAGGAVKDDAYYDESHSPSGYGSPIMYGGQQPT